MALLLIDSSVTDYNKITEATLSTVTSVIFDSNTDTFQTLKEKILGAVGEDATIPLVGFISHSNPYNPFYVLLHSQSVPAQIMDSSSMDPNLDSWAEVREFYNWLKSTYHVSTIDLITCAIYAVNDWVYVLQTLETQCGLNFRASVNNTGNVASGGDWIQESDGVDIKPLYFTDQIVNFERLLYTPTNLNNDQMVVLPGATINSIPISGRRTRSINVGTGVGITENYTTAGSTRATLIRAWGNSGAGGSGAPFGTDLTAISGGYDAFAGLRNDGAILAWGNSSGGGTGGPGDASYKGITSSQIGFVARRNDDTLYGWPYEAPAGGYVLTASNPGAFCAVRNTDGRVIAWGQTAYGGIGNTFYSGISVVSNGKAFTLRTPDNSLYSWGDSGYGGGRFVSDATTSVTANEVAFCAINFPGSSLRVYGSPTQGGSGAPSDGGFYDYICGSFGGFAALKADTTIRVWGDSSATTNAPSTSTTGFTSISSTNAAFAALKSDGSIVAWGLSNGGGTGAPTGSGFVAIQSNIGAFAALKSDGSIVAWGNSGNGGSGAPSGSGYMSIASTEQAFAAIKSDGSIVSWGNSGYGGSGAPSGSGYFSIVSNNKAFAALRNISYTQVVNEGLTSSVINNTTDPAATISLNIRGGIKTSSGAPQATGKTDFINTMRSRFGLTTTLSSSQLSDFKGTMISGSEQMTVARSVVQYFPTLGGSSGTVDITGIPTDRSQYVCIELPYNIPVSLTVSGSTVGTVFFDGTNVRNGTNGSAPVIPVGSSPTFGSKTIGFVGVGSLVGVAGPATATQAVAEGLTFNYVRYSTDSTSTLIINTRAAIKASSGSVQSAAKTDYINAMIPRLGTFTFTMPSSQLASFKTTMISGSDNLTSTLNIVFYYPTISGSNGTLDIGSIPTDRSVYICIELPYNIPVTLTISGSTVGTVFFDGTNVRNGANGSAPVIPVGSSPVFGSKTLGFVAVGSLVGFAGTVSDATHAVASGLTYNYVRYSSDATSTMAINTRAAIKASSGSLQTAAKTDYINGMLVRAGSLKFTIPSSQLADFKNTMIAGTSTMTSTLDVVLYFPTISTGILNIDDFPTNRSQYICVELPYNIPISLRVGGSTVTTLFFDGTNVYNGSNGSAPLISIGSTVTCGSKALSYVAIGSLVGFSGPPPSTASQAITEGLLTNYILYDTATSATVAINTRGAINALSAGPTQTAARTDYINTMITRLGAYQLVIPSSQLASFKATLLNGASNLSSTLDVVLFYPTLGGLSGSLDITDLPNDQSQYSCIELPYNLSIGLTILGNSVGSLYFDGTNVRRGSNSSAPIIPPGTNVVLGTTELRNVAIGSLTGLGFSVSPSVISYGNSTWIAGSLGGQLRRSTDGVIWSVVAISMFTAIKSVQYNGVMWLCSGNGTETIAYSYDGITWNPTGNTLFTGGTVNSVAWNGRLWVAGAGGTTKLGYSYNGIYWFSGTNSALTTEVNNVTWTGSRWIAVGSGTNTIATSPDGITWTGVTNSVLASGGSGVACTLSVGSTYIQHPVLALGQQSTNLNVGTIIYNWTYDTDPALTSFTFTFNGVSETLTAATRTKTYTNLLIGNIYTASIKANFSSESSQVVNFSNVQL